VTVRDLTFTAGNAGATGLKTRGASYCYLQNLDFAGSGTAMDIGSNASNDIGIQGSDLRFTGGGRALLLNATRSIFTNLIVSEGISGLDVFNIGNTGAGYCVIDGFYALASGGTGGTAGIIINTNAHDCVLSNGTLDSCYTDGINVGAGRNNKVIGVGIINAQGHGLVLNGSLQPRIDVAIQGASASGAGNADCIHLVNGVTDGLVTASFQGTNPTNDINETTGAITNMLYLLRGLPNGLSLASSSSTVISPGATRLGGSSGTLGAFGNAGAVKATITGALSSVTDANAKAVLTSILSMLTGYNLASNGTT
jgi:hypothetical protein